LTMLWRLATNIWVFPSQHSKLSILLSEVFYAQNLSTDKLAVAKQAPLMILKMDGKGIVMRKEDLRPTTPKKCTKYWKYVRKQTFTG